MLLILESCRPELSPYSNLGSALLEDVYLKERALPILESVELPDWDRSVLAL